MLQAALLGTRDEICEQPAGARQEEKQVRHAGDREQLSLSYMMQGVPTSLDISSNLKELLPVHCTLCITHRVWHLMAVYFEGTLAAISPEKEQLSFLFQLRFPPKNDKNPYLSMSAF